MPGGGGVLATAAGTYLLAWVVGLVVAPASPGAFATAAEVHAFFAAHGGAALVQSALVHGVAGLALAGWVLAVAARSRRARRSVAAAGLAAALLSLVQAATMAVLVVQAEAGRVSATDDAFDLINRLDTFKLLALGVLVALASVQGRGQRPAWLGWFGAGAAVLLPVSGAAFLVDVPALTSLLFASLPLLLAWVGAMTLVLLRSSVRMRRGAGAAARRSARSRAG
ncbi:hypothetical protein GB882_09155 [Georgenia ruanii]|uniref:DUF4386 family protein n=2 Tax=Georgenia ruanii TaxID=348442 RepID=A0A7J9UW31_9MICO|nr:hypothetical protein [Georgenia ruanii]